MLLLEPLAMKESFKKRSLNYFKKYFKKVIAGIIKEKGFPYNNCGDLKHNNCKMSFSP